MIQIIIKCEAGRSWKGNLWNSAKIHFLSQCSWNTNVAQRSGKIACLTGMKSHGIHRIRSKLSTLRLSLMSIDTLQNTRPGQPLDIDSFAYLCIPIVSVICCKRQKIIYNIRHRISSWIFIIKDNFSSQRDSFVFRKNFKILRETFVEVDYFFRKII